MERLWQMSMTNKANEHVGFHYLFIKILLYALILLKLNIFHKKYEAKSKTNPSRTAYSEYKMTTELCVYFTVSLS